MVGQRVESPLQVKDLQGIPFFPPVYLRGENGVRIVNLDLPKNWLLGKNANFGGQQDKDDFYEQSGVLKLKPLTFDVDTETGLLTKASVLGTRESSVELVTRQTRTGVWVGGYSAENLENWEAAIVLGGVVARNINYAAEVRREQVSTPWVEASNELENDTSFSLESAEIPLHLHAIEKTSGD